MTKVPSLNYPEIVQAFERGGWELVRQKGSHMRLERTEAADRTLKVTIPAHKPVKRSTLAHILKQAEMSVEEFIELL
ncbi:MAG TPA: type II toxin-antitoxin system HicA family toxin [Rhodothermales bacterium]|nr:type II toxin-antitoxin system HicA family toxin [Rhodothermales bacterium]